MDWAQNFNMDYAQNLKKDPLKDKKDPNKIYTGYCQLILQLYNTRNFAAISSNLILTTIFKNVLVLCTLEMIK